MNDDDLIGGFTKERDVIRRPTGGTKKQPAPAGEFHASHDGKVTVCGTPMVGRTQPWSTRPMGMRRCAACVAEVGNPDQEPAAR
ncbi:MAG TPA: hypothetical protein VGX25_23080 [Actinophytocola sp.]|uniref:hypothetical protein n=1 Tax=Actinophytocola sp. TaxID=1872138 RepID=UPI002DDDBA24|nr:hypothetical protein [Actinophytocola sp.]HEV2782285.1 hypothetical protein [Actinophytocola sp.]